jgi:maltose O-acetyltransferase
MNRVLKVSLRTGLTLCRKLMRSRIGKAVIISASSEFRIVQDINLKESLRHCGDEIHFQQPIWITHPNCVEIGTKVSFAAYVHVWGGGGVKIGDRVMIGSHTAITSVTHDYHSEVMYGTVVTKPVVIGDDVWIGAHAVILPGVKIGEGAVIGAGAIVSTDVPDYAVVVGIPGRVVRFRPNVCSVKEKIDC